MTTRRIGMLGLAVSVVLALSGCAPSTGSPGTDPRLLGQWKLVSATDFGGQIELPAATITLTIAQGQTPHGRGPCSDYSARIIGSPGAVFVTVTHRTSNFCVDSGLRPTETRYLEALNATTLASVAGGDLTLAGPRSKLSFRPADTVDLAPIVDKTWVAQSIITNTGRGASVMAAPQGVNLRLAANSSFVVNTLCSSPTGSWSVDAGEVVLSRIQNADSVCSTVDEHNRDIVMRVLSQGVTVRVRGTTLTVTNQRTQETMFLSLTPPD